MPDPVAVTDDTTIDSPAVEESAQSEMVNIPPFRAPTAYMFDPAIYGAKAEKFPSLLPPTPQAVVATPTDGEQARSEITTMSTHPVATRAVVDSAADEESAQSGSTIKPPVVQQSTDSMELVNYEGMVLLVPRGTPLRTADIPVKKPKEHKEHKKADIPSTSDAELDPGAAPSKGAGKYPALRPTGMKPAKTPKTRTKKQAGDPVKIRKFYLFKKLPKELQCRIWRWSFESRIIRVRYTYDNVGPSTHYHLACGPVPGILHVNSEARYEGLKYYTAIRSRAPLERGFDGYKRKDKSRIYMNFEIDTLYFVSYPVLLSFLSWVRRIPREEEKKIDKTSLVTSKDNDKQDSAKNVTKNAELRMVKHVAFSNGTIANSLRTTRTNVGMPNILDAWYGMVLDNPLLKTITLVQDVSQFKNSNADMQLEKYSFKALQPVPHDPVNPTNPWTNAWWSHYANRGVVHFHHLLKDHWDKPLDRPTDQVAKYKEWRQSEKGREWVPPVFELAKISLAKK